MWATETQLRTRFHEAKPEQKKKKQMNAETRIGQFPRSSATADDVANGRRSQKQKIARNGNIARRGSIGRAIKSESSVSIFP